MKMKQYKLLFSAACIILSLASAAMADGWIKLTSDAGKFSVLMPGPKAPEEKAETTTESKDVPASAPYTTHLFMQTSDKGVRFLVGWVDYAPGFKPNPQGELAANRDNFIKGVKAKLATERPITLGQNPGIEFTGAAEDGAAIKARVYMVGARPYMLVALTPKGKDDSVNADKFFDSFKLK